MRLAYNRKIGTRLGYGLGIIIVLMILLGTIAIVKMNKIAAVTAKLYDHSLMISNTVGDIRAEIFSMSRSMKDVVLAKTAEQLDTAKDTVSESEQHVIDLFKVVFERFLGDKRDVEAAYKAFIEWQPIRQEVIELMRCGKQEEAAEITKGKGAEHVDYMNERIQTISDSASKRAETFFNNAQSSAQSHLSMMVGLVLLITGICILIGIFLTRSITKPVRYIIGEISKVADGNLDHKINLNSDDEIGLLARTFDNMTGNLKKITASRNELDAANQQLDAANQQLGASNQQLRAGEQQLKAANQQLQATDQQLKANVEELRQGKTVYKAMFEGAISGIAIYEGVNEGGDFIFKDVNPAAEKIDKIKKQNLTGKSVKDVLPGVYEMGVFDALKRVWKTGKEEYLPAAIYKDKEIKEWRENHIFKLSSGEVVVFYKDITELKQAEEQLKENNEQLRALTAKLSFTEERERKHIAEGIHDSIIQPLVFLDVKAKSLGKTTKDTKLIEAYSQMRTILNELIEKARTFILDLSYPILYELGLEPAIEEWLQTEIEDKHEIAVEFKVKTQSKDLDQNIATFLFKSAKELLINVVKHAKANNVKVSIARKQNNIILCVEDDGCGFKSFRSGKKQNSLTGFGLFNIREQATYLGGEVSIDSKAGIGSKIILTVPLTVPLKDEA